MRALTVEPGKASSIDLENVPSPSASDGTILVRALALGICGTDREIIAGQYGVAPEGRKHLIIGHESLGEVEEAPAGSGFEPGDRVVGIVRRPDPVPCRACAQAEWDMCRNGRYTERGIKQRDGYGAEFFRLEPEFAVKIEPALRDLGVLLEPASVVTKAWEHARHIFERARASKPRVALVTGAGPIGLLAALIGKQQGLEVHVFDRVVDGPKPAIVRELGAAYHTELGALEADLVMECTGAASVVCDVLGRIAPDGVVCLSGVSSGGYALSFDIGAFNRAMVLENHVVFGSVSANRRHYQAAAQLLAKADPMWLKQLITRRVPLQQWREAFEKREGDIKVLLEFA